MNLYKTQTEENKPSTVNYICWSVRLCANIIHQAHDSVFARCTLWHRPNASRSRYESRVLWCVISLVIVVVVVTVNAVIRSIREKISLQRRTS